MTSIEREEKEKVKKREKKLEDEETLQQATWVKYTIPIKHQVWYLLSIYVMPIDPQQWFPTFAFYTLSHGHIRHNPIFHSMLYCAMLVYFVMLWITPLRAGGVICMTH